MIKRITIATCAIALLLAVVVLHAQGPQDITTSSTTCPGAGCAQFSTTGQGTIAIQITGTWSGTLTFYASVDAVNYVALNVTPPNSTTAVTTTTSNGIWGTSIAGLQSVRVLVTTPGTGTATVVARTALSAHGGAGSSGGGGGISSISTTSPVTGGPITTTGTIACATCGVTGTGLQQFASTTSAQLAGVISDETGSGTLVFGTSPTLITPALGTPTALVLTNATGLPGGTCTNQVATAIGGTGNPTCTTVTSAYVDSSIPTATSTTTFTNKRITKRVTTASDATSITPNSDSADITYQLNTQGTGTLTINADGGTPTNGQSWVLKIKSTNVQTFSWNAVYVGGTIALPTTSTGTSKIDYFSFIYDTVNSKWDFTGTAAGF